MSVERVAMIHAITLSATGVCLSLLLGCGTVHAEPLSELASDDWKVSEGGSGVDIRYLADDGVPGVGHRVDGSRYFDVHHSRADSFEKVDPQLVTRNLAVIAGFIFAVADSPDLPERSQP